MGGLKSIAIIGAGIAGLSLAKELDGFADVTVFEKSRGVGGRMATRYTEDYKFDHGAPFFTARSQNFQKFIKAQTSQGIVGLWDKKVITLEKDKKPKDRIWFEPHYIGTPNMNSLCKDAANGLSVVTNTEIGKIASIIGGGFQFFNKSGEVIGDFDIVISTAPPAQSLNLLGGFIESDCFIRNIEMMPQFSIMVGLKQKWTRPWIAAKVQNSPLNWIYINSTKSGRDEKNTAITATTEANWSKVKIEENPQEIGPLLMNELSQLIELDFSDAFITCHKWRYSLPPNKDEAEVFWKPEIGIGAIGDWCGGKYSPVENAWRAAQAIAAQIKKSL